MAAGPFLFHTLIFCVAGVSVALEMRRAVTPHALFTLAWLAVLIVGFGTLSLNIVAARDSIVISRREISISSGFWGIRRTRRIPLSTIKDVKVEAFGFANWDPYVKIVTSERTFRAAWGVSDASARQIAELIRGASAPGG